MEVYVIQERHATNKHEAEGERMSSGMSSGNVVKNIWDVDKSSIYLTTFFLNII